MAAASLADNVSRYAAAVIHRVHGSLGIDGAVGPPAVYTVSLVDRASVPLRSGEATHIRVAYGACVTVNVGTTSEESIPFEEVEGVALTEDLRSRNGGWRALLERGLYTYRRCLCCSYLLSVLVHCQNGTSTLTYDMLRQLWKITHWKMKMDYIEEIVTNESFAGLFAVHNGVLLVI